MQVSNDTDLLGGSFRLLITGKDNLGNNFTQSQYITSYPTNQENLVFIQTDKPLYKVGDTVRFRVISVGRDLIPLNVPAEVKIYVGARDLLASQVFSWRPIAGSTKKFNQAVPEEQRDRFVMVQKTHGILHQTWFRSNKYAKNNLRLSRQPPIQTLTVNGRA